MRSSIKSTLLPLSIVGLFVLSLSDPIFAKADIDPAQLIGRNVKFYGASNSGLKPREISSGNNGSIDLSWRNTIKFSATHQSPAEAPPVPMSILDNRTMEASTPISTLNSRHIDFNSFQKRDGALHCDDAPCVDGSCCSKDGICGYGPDFCGDGCRSQCDATAMCGEFSEDADVPCGMNLCCSATGWCGTTKVYCDNADPIHHTLPCQAGYGGCQIYDAPICDASANSAGGRTVGYYQSWNVRERKCNTKTPKQLDTTGYTHLFYSFAFIDPVSKKITAAHADDEAMMKEFTALSKPGGLQTWIAIGGFDFSNPGLATHTTWSEMCSTAENRAAFISSVETYMETYGFQGVDLDWEYPGEVKRGGRGTFDTRNFVKLVKEMRAAFGDRYGISLTLAPDYWYLRWFDAKGMEPYVDFFGFMAYDLHGSWDQDVLTLGSKVRGQADIREIEDNTTPLWFDGLDPKKINFGMALYGRGYTLSNSSCNGLLCPFSGPSKASPCVGEPGVMSLSEIKQVIQEKNLRPEPLYDSMMKQITWDDQWIGYDDADTMAEKKKFASSMCFGGTMVWSIDFQETAANNTEFPDIPDLPNHGLDKGLHGTPFAKFTGCDSISIEYIRQAWNDVAELVSIPSKLNLASTSSSCQGICDAGEIETRFWGKDIKTRGRNIDIIQRVFTNIYQLSYSDHATGRISISCVDNNLPASDGSIRTCGGSSGGGVIGAYAGATSTDYRDNEIVVCQGFFDRIDFTSVKGNLKNEESKRKDPVAMSNRAMALLHELTHLPAICEKYPTIILDQYVKWNQESDDKPESIYGVKQCEKLPRKYQNLAARNADNYAWYAVEKYFQALYGTPDAQFTGRDEDIGNEPDTNPTPTPTKALNIIIQDREIDRDDGWYTSELTWLFYSVPYGTASECNDSPVTRAAAAADIVTTDNPPFPAGTFSVKTQDGDCEYKNDGTGNPGALWCSGTQHACKEHRNKNQKSGDVICDKLKKKGDRFVMQRAIVACEW